MHAAQGLILSVKSVSAPFFAFLFPPSCLACLSPLSNNSSSLCLACTRCLRRVDKHDAVFQRTLLALTSDGSLDGMVAPFYFEKEGPLQQLIHKLKYGGMTRIGVLVGEEIAAGIAGHRGDGNAVIVPVPLHRAKRRERGYNQSYFIGRGISRELGVPVREWALRREIYTRSQTTLDIIERAKNVEGAFRVPSRSVDALRGKTVLLVDDVITTGATIRACAAALREANVERIIACAAALAI